MLSIHGTTEPYTPHCYVHVYVCVLMSECVQVHIWVPGKYLGRFTELDLVFSCMDLAEYVTSGIPKQPLLCVRNIKGKCAGMNERHPFHYTYLISDFYYTHGANLRILP